jgi:hypothetical protein
MCFVHTASWNVTVGEYFITFEVCDDSTGNGLPEKIKAAERPEMFDCHGQGYDSGTSRSAGNYFMLKPKAFSDPYGSHNLNFLLGDVATSLVIAVNFAGTLQKSIPHLQCQHLIGILKQ